MGHLSILQPEDTVINRNARRSYRIKIHFKDSKGDLIKTIEGNEGDDILSLAHEHDIDLEGACEGSIACSTCHIVLPPEYYDLLDEPGDDENDMLDMAFGLTDTSRLGCQVILDRKLDGMTCMLPAATRNMFVDGESTIPPQWSPPYILSLTGFIKGKSQRTTDPLFLSLSCPSVESAMYAAKPRDYHNHTYGTDEPNTTPLRPRPSFEPGRQLCVTPINCGSSCRTSRTLS